MRYPLLTALLLASSSPVTAQGIAICSGDTYVAYSTWDRAGQPSARVVSLTRPLTEESRREIAGSGGATVLDCAASGARLTAAVEGAPERRLSPESARPVIVTCEGVAGAPQDLDGYTVQHGFSLATSRIRPFPESRGPLHSDDTFYLVTSVDAAGEPGPRRVRVTLRERVTRRVERQLELFEAVCPAAGSG